MTTSDSRQARPAFVRVHGGRHGGWCWSRTTRALRDRGFEAHAPTLTGLGDRAHLLSRAIDLDCHIEHVVDALPEGRGERFRESAARAGFGWLIPPVPAARRGIRQGFGGLEGGIPRPGRLRESP